MFSHMSLIYIKKCFQIHNDTKDINTFKWFQVPIGNEKCVESFNFQIDAPILKYCHKSLNSCCFSSLASAFASINHNNAANAVSLRIKESLKIEVGNHIDFENDILNIYIYIGEAKVHYNLIKI